MTSILAITFGSMCNFEPGDPRLHEGFALTVEIGNCFSPAERAAEFFPPLKLVLPQNKEKFVQLRRKMVSFYGAIVKEFRELLESGRADECFMKNIMQ
ncbi:hypothetical protein BC940DRAFT_220032, partial [Gongronella butleri]